MAGGGSAPARRGQESDKAPEISIHRLEAAKQSRGLTAALGGTCVAIFTFLLFFLYPRFAAGEVDPNLFQLTLFAVLVSLYLLLFASWYFFLFTQILGRDASRAAKYLTWADASFAGGVIVLALAPALVLFTIRLQVLGFIALGLWGFYVLVFVSDFANLRRSERGRDDPG